MADGRQTEPLRVAVIGMGFGAAVARSSNRNPLYEVRWVCDVDESRSRRWGEELDLPWTTSYEQVLEDPEVEAVLIYTPPHLHGEHIRMAAEAGKSIRVTKPFERHSRAAREAIAACERAGVALTLDSPPPCYTGAYSLVHELQKDDRLGQLITGNMWTGAFYGNIDREGNWYDDPYLCVGGPLYRLGIYGINFYNVALGTPRTVSATQSWVRSTRPTPDTTSLTITYENGAIVSILNSLSWNGMRYPDSIVLCGTNATLLHNPNFLEIGRKMDALLRVHDEMRQVEEKYLNKGGDTDRFFLEMVREDRSAEISLTPALDGVRVIEAAYASLVEGRSVHLDEIGV